MKYDYEGLRSHCIPKHDGRVERTVTIKRRPAGSQSREWGFPA